jgi:hypothetical protein
MKFSLSIFLFLLFFPAAHIFAQKTATTKTAAAPFQGMKKFCSYAHNSTYTITVRGISVKIVFRYNNDSTTIQGTLKNNKLYTNDPDEKANKNLAGKYYLLTATTFRIINTESGDYDDYHICDH